MFGVYRHIWRWEIEPRTRRKACLGLDSTYCDSVNYANITQRVTMYICLPLWETQFGSYSVTSNPEFFVCHWQHNYLSIYWQHVPVFFSQKYWETDWKCVRLQWNWQTFLFGMTQKKKVSVSLFVGTAVSKFSLKKVFFRRWPTECKLKCTLSHLAFS